MPTSLGLVGIVDKGNYSSAATYVKGNFVYYNGSTWLCISNTSVSNIEPTEVNNTTWKYLAKGFNVQPFSGATASADGTGGTVPQPHAGDEDKVLQGNGTFGKKLQIDIVIQNNQYGYINGSNQFVAFKSQADIDAAVSAAKVGNATAADVLAGKTFTNSSNSGVSGSMPARTNGTSATGSGIDGTGPWVYMPYGYYPEYSGNAGNSYIYMTAAQAVNACPKQEKTVTAGTSAASVTPDEGKLLSKVTYNPTPSEERTATAGTSNVTVTPNSGKLMSKVTISPTPSQTKSCTPSTSPQTVSPDSGKLLSSVSVSAIQTETKNVNLNGGNTNTQQTITPSSGKYLTSVKIPNLEFSASYRALTSASGITVEVGDFYIVMARGGDPNSTQAKNNAESKATPTSGGTLIGNGWEVKSALVTSGSSGGIYESTVIVLVKTTSTTLKFGNNAAGVYIRKIATHV